LAIPGFIRSLADVIDEFDLRADSVCPEVTERALVYDMQTGSSTLSGQSA
jgi:hypothetical protein